ncbi:MAG TPA: sortase [Pseudonocardiaceae bacterium]|nr:sortase [Pseudonocardiaceae bacterium]
MSAVSQATRRGLRSAARTAALVLLATSTTLLAGCGAAHTAPALTSAAPAASAPAAVGLPTRVEIPAIEVDESLVPVGLLANGAMQTPDFGLAAWYEPGPRPGGPGPAVILAHVDSKAGPDVFYRLRELTPGDRVTVHRTEGSTTFTVDSLEQVDKNRLPYHRIWPRTTEPVLRLITCGGTFDHSTGNYRDNIIVYARSVP